MMGTFGEAYKELGSAFTSYKGIAGAQVCCYFRRDIMFPVI